MSVESESTLFGGNSTTSDSNFLGPVYEQNKLVSILHAFPRFGRSDDVTLLLTEEQSDTVEYTLGAGFLTMLMSAFFLTWALFILVCNCLGPKEVGFLSGTPMREAKASEDRDRHVLRPRRVRLAFLFSGFLLVASVLVLLFVGLPLLENALHNLENSTTEANSLIDNGFALSRSLSNIATNTESLRDDLVVDLKVFCPNGNFSDILGGLQLSDVVDALEQVDNFALNELESLKTTLNGARSGTVMVADGVDAYFEFKYLPIYWAPLLLFTALLMCGVILAWAKKSRKHVSCLLSYFILPIFSIWIIGTVLLAGAAALSGVTNADSCSGGDAPGSPAGTLVAALERLQTEEASGNGMLVDTLEYYAGGCRTNSPFEFMDDFIVRLESALAASNKMIIAVEQFGIDGVSSQCGEDISATSSALQTFYANAQSLIGDAKDARDLISCERLNPLYVQTFHQSTCQQSPVSIVWIWGCLLVIACCGMIMITLRSAILPIRYLDPTAFGAANRHYDHDLKLSESHVTTDGKRLGMNTTGSMSQYQSSRDEYDEYVESMRRQGVEEERRHVTLEQPYLPSDAPSRSGSWDRGQLNASGSMSQSYRSSRDEYDEYVESMRRQGVEEERRATVEQPYLHADAPSRSGSWDRGHDAEIPTPRSQRSFLGSRSFTSMGSNKKAPAPVQNTDQHGFPQPPMDSPGGQKSPYHVIHRKSPAPNEAQTPAQPRDQFLPDALPPAVDDPEPAADWLTFQDDKNYFDDAASRSDSATGSVPNKDTIIY